MIDSPTYENLRDFSARYKGTYGFYLMDDHTRRLVRVVDVGDESVRFVDMDGFEYYATVSSGAKFEFIPVNRGFFNGKVFTYFLERIPARQWHRGICSSNTKVQTVGNNGINKYLLVDSVIRELFEPNHQTSFNKAYENFMADISEAVAISKNFCLTNELLWFYNLPVGKVDKKMRTVSGIPQVVSQETSDAFRRQGLNWGLFNA